MHSSLETYDKVPAFLYKLWKLVEDRSTDHLIRWQEDGKSFILYKQGQFSRELLPQYYKHANMASFVRQLNMYGFRKVPSMEGGGLRLDRDEMEFAHPHFIRGQEHQLEYIKRKTTNSREPGTGGAVDDSRMADLMTEVQALHRKQEKMIMQMDTLRQENANVWARYVDINDKLTMQNNIIEKLTRFVVSVLKPKGLNLSNVRRIPQLQALFGGHSMVPALTQGSNRSPLSDGPVIHEVVDDVFSTTDADDFNTQPLHLTNSIHQPHLPTSTGGGHPTSTGAHPAHSSVTTTITEPAGVAASGSTVNNNSRVLSLAGVPSNVYSVVDGAGNVMQCDTLSQQQQQQQHLFAGSEGVEDVYITPDIGHLSTAATTEAVYNTSNMTAAGNFVDGYGNPVPVSSISGLPVNSNPIVESPKGSRLSDVDMVREGVTANSGLQGTSSVNSPMMVTIAGTNTNSPAASSNATVFLGDNSHLTPTSFVQTVRDNFSSSDNKVRRGVAQIKSSTASSTGHNVSGGFNSRGPPTLTFTVGPNNTLIPTKDTQVVLGSTNDPNVFSGVPIKQEIVLGAPLITLGSSSTTTTTAPFLTRTGKQQHIVTNVSVIPNSNRVSITNMSNSGNKNVGSVSSGKQQAVITNLEDALIQDNNLISSKRGFQNTRTSAGKKQIVLKCNNNASSSTGNNFNNTISTMGNIISSNNGMPSASSTGQSVGVKREKGAQASTSSSDGGATSTASGGAAMPVFKVVRKQPTQQQAPQQQSSLMEDNSAAATELLTASANLTSESPTTDVVPLSNNVGMGCSRGPAASEPPAASARLHDLASVGDSAAGATSDVALPSGSGQGYPSREDMTKQMEDVQNMLDNLQDLFQSGHLERDQNAIFSHIFNPDFPLSDFETMAGLDMSPDQTGSSSSDCGLQQQRQLALYNPSATQDLTALLDSPGRSFISADDDQPFAMASLDPDLINTPNVQSRTPPRKKMRTTAPVKKEPGPEDEEGLDPFLSSLYSQGNT